MTQKFILKDQSISNQLIYTTLIALTLICFECLLSLKKIKIEIEIEIKSVLFFPFKNHKNTNCKKYTIQ